MTGIGAARRLLVVLALIAGLLGMHALVVVDADHRMPAPVAATQQSPPMAAAGEPGMPAPTSGHPGAHQLLHLCLAVLAGLVILLVGLARLRAPVSPDEASRRGRGRRPPPGRPPPTSQRLARLCVMRN